MCCEKRKKKHGGGKSPPQKDAPRTLLWEKTLKGGRFIVCCIKKSETVGEPKKKGKHLWSLNQTERELNEEPRRLMKKKGVSFGRLRIQGSKERVGGESVRQ